MAFSIPVLALAGAQHCFSAFCAYVGNNTHECHELVVTWNGLNQLKRVVLQKNRRKREWARKKLTCYALLHPSHICLVQISPRLFYDCLLVTGREGVIVVIVAFGHYILIIGFQIHCWLLHRGNSVELDTRLEHGECRT